MEPRLKSKYSAASNPVVNACCLCRSKALQQSRR